MVRHLFPAMIAASLILASSPSPAATILLTVEPGQSAIPVGSASTVELFILDLVDFAVPSLGAFDLVLAFDPSVLTFVSEAYGDVALGDQLDLLNLGAITGTSSLPGAVNLFELSLDSETDLNALQRGDFRLATLSFVATHVGISPLDLTINALADASGAPIPVNVTNSSITVTAVPEGSASMLLLTGLAALAWRLGHRRSSLF